MTEHVEYDALAVGFALGTLDWAEQRRLCQHAMGCVTCAEIVADTREIAAAMATLVPLVEPPPALGEAISAAIRVEPRTLASEPLVAPAVPAPSAGPVLARRTGGRRADRRGAPVGHRPARPRAARIVAGIAAAAVVIALAGFGVVQTRRVSDRTSAAAEQRRVLALLAEPGARTLALATRPGKQGTARVVLAEGRAWVVSEGLAANDTRSTSYVLWGIRGNAVTGLATFDVPDRALSVVDAGPLAGSVTRTPQFAVSFEQQRTIPAKPSDIVLLG